MDIRIIPVDSINQNWAIETLTQEWGADFIVTRGQVHYYRNLSGFVAILDSQPVGLATYRIINGQCELTSLNVHNENNGIGTNLLQAVEKTAMLAKCERVWLITTNDNTRALHFYQKRGYSLVAIYRDALVESRRLKPTIPLTGNDGIPLRDEIELEMLMRRGTF